MALLGPGNFGMHWGGRGEKAEDYSLEEKEEEEEEVFLEEMQSAAAQAQGLLSRNCALLHWSFFVLYCPKRPLYYAFLLGGEINVSLHFCTQ